MPDDTIDPGSEVATLPPPPAPPGNPPGSLILRGPQSPETQGMVLQPPPRMPAPSPTAQLDAWMAQQQKNDVPFAQAEARYAFRLSASTSKT
jgi:hypothetical protein